MGCAVTASGSAVSGKSNTVVDALAVVGEVWVLKRALGPLVGDCISR